MSRFQKHALNPTERQQAVAVLSVAFKLLHNRAPREIEHQLVHVSDWLIADDCGRKSRRRMLTAIADGAEVAL